MKILLATNNGRKVTDISAFIDTYFPELEIVTPKELGIEINPDETGKTYAENSIIKANAFYDALGEKQSEYAVLSDDEGFEFENSPNYPGVRSAREIEKYGDGFFDDHLFEKVTHHVAMTIKTSSTTETFTDLIQGYIVPGEGNQFNDHLVLSAFYESGNMVKFSDMIPIDRVNMSPRSVLHDICSLLEE